MQYLQIEYIKFALESSPNSDWFPFSESSSFHFVIEAACLRATVWNKGNNSIFYFHADHATNQLHRVLFEIRQGC